MSREIIKTLFFSLSRLISIRFDPNRGNNGRKRFWINRFGRFSTDGIADNRGSTGISEHRPHGEREGGQPRVAYFWGRGNRSVRVRACGEEGGGGVWRGILSMARLFHTSTRPTRILRKKTRLLWTNYEYPNDIISSSGFESISVCLFILCCLVLKTERRKFTPSGSTRPILSSKWSAYDT